MYETDPGYMPPPDHRRKVTEPLVKMGVNQMLRGIVIFCAAAILAHLLASRLVSIGLGVLFDVMRSVKGADYDTFAATFNSSAVQYVINTFYTVFVVGGPFVLVRLCFRAQRHTPIPMGRPKAGRRWALLVVIGLGMCMLGNLLSSYLDMFMNAITGTEIFDASLESLPESPMDLVMFVVSTAIAPALIEELVFRGILMQPLRAISDRFALVTTAILFGLIHHNPAQIPFAIIAGLVIGYATIVTESLWTGVCIHLLNNLYAVVVTTVYDRFGATVIVNLVTDVVFYGMILAGIVLTILYFSKEKNRAVFRETNNFRFPWYPAGTIPFGVRVSTGGFIGRVFSHPLMLVAVLWMFAETVETAIQSMG